MGIRPVIVTGLVAAAAVVVAGVDLAYRESDSVAGRVFGDVAFSRQNKPPTGTGAPGLASTTSGARDRPMALREGRAFEVGGLHYNDGWNLVASAHGKLLVNATVRNRDPRAATHGFEITVMRGNKIVASAVCITALLPSKRTDAVKCASGDDWPVPHDTITMHGTFGQPLNTSWILAPNPR